MGDSPKINRLSLRSHSKMSSTTSLRSRNKIGKKNDHIDVFPNFLSQPWRYFRHFWTWARRFVYAHKIYLYIIINNIRPSTFSNRKKQAEPVWSVKLVASFANTCLRRMTRFFVEISIQYWKGGKSLKVQQMIGTRCAICNPWFIVGGGFRLLDERGRFVCWPADFPGESNM